MNPYPSRLVASSSVPPLTLVPFCVSNMFLFLLLLPVLPLMPSPQLLILPRAYGGAVKPWDVRGATRCSADRLARGHGAGEADGIPAESTN